MLLSAAFAYRAIDFFDRHPPTQVVPAERFDPAMPWLAAALAALLVAAWRPVFPNTSPRLWIHAVVAFLRNHWVEVLIFSAILAFGVFMRVYRFGDSLPAADGMCCEEKINGGVAYSAIHGARPILFPLVRWGAAFGFLTFGETTFGLRFFFVVGSIAAIVPFYLLVRQLVSVPVALFGAALFAAAWWPSLRARQASDITIYAVLLAFFFVTGIRKRSPVMLLAAGIVAGLVEYEYEAYRVIPLAAVGFAGAAALREVVLRRPLALDGIVARARSLVVIGWRPAVVFLMAAGITLVPLAVGTWHSHDLFFTSLRRQEHKRGDNLFVDNWPEQAAWTAQIFLPVGPQDYPTEGPRDPEGVRLLDPVTATLVIAGVAAGLLLFFRGFQLLFVGWVLSTAITGSLLLSQYAAWKFVGLVPILIVLGALLVEEARAFAVRRFGTRASLAAVVAMMALAAFVFWWNADTLYNDVDMRIRPGYGRVASMLYSHCDYLRGRGAENFTYSFENSGSIRGFAAPHTKRQDQAVAWGDLIWACHDLRGEAIAAPEEAWPLRGVPAGPVTLAFAGTFRSTEPIIAAMNTAYPGVGPPDFRSDGPAGLYRIIGYEFASGSELERRGLWADYTTTEGDLIGSRVDQAWELDWGKHPPPSQPPFNVRWQGLIYVEEAGPTSLLVVGDGPAIVRLDGEAVHDTRSSEPVTRFLDLVAGWHVVEITLDKATDSGTAALVLAAPNGTHTPVQAADLFPLPEPSGWRHERSFGNALEPHLIETQRIDFQPHLASAGALKRQIQADDSELFVTEERWSGVWDVEESGVYYLDLDFVSGSVSVLVDDELLFATDDRRAAQAQVRVESGRHTIELRQEIDRDGIWSGLTVAAYRQIGPDERSRGPVTLQIAPY